MARRPLGTVLAGGAGERLGRSKATVELAGRPLISYPLAAFAAAGVEAIVVAKPGTELPPLEVTVLTEPAEPRHPLLGLVTALTHAAGRPIVACACDTPFVTAELLTRLIAAGATAAVARRRAPPPPHRPLRARRPRSSWRARFEAGRSATSALEALSPALVETGPEVTFNVNTPGDLAAAAARVQS